MFIDRVNDTARFASLAEPALRTGRMAVLGAEMRKYDALFNIAAVVVGRDGRPVLTSREQLDMRAPAVQSHINAALSGQRSGFSEVVWPWGDVPLVVAEPVGSGGEIVGAVLTVSPTGPLHDITWRSWAVVAAASAALLILGAVIAGPLAGWMLRPVHDLDNAAHALTEGRYGDRAVVVSGPPELRRLARSFNTMADRIATLVGRQRSFVSYASHQLRTPLATLRLCVENLKPAVHRDGIDDYRLVAEEIERLGRMCEALLAYARAEATAGDVADVDTAAVADTRVAVWRPAAEQAGVRLIRASRDGAIARAATQAVDQALDALISNAVKFAGPGSEVVVTASAGLDGWVDIDVVDSGPGMPPDDLAHAAEAFWRRTTDQNVEGWGLGVTIADALVTASGGRLDLMPAVPHGIHARIRLPAASAPRS
jgi:signal transduction histidine kinase